MSLFVQRLESGEHYDSLMIVAIYYIADANYIQNFCCRVADDCNCNRMNVVELTLQEHFDYAKGYVEVYWMV